MTEPLLRVEDLYKSFGSLEVLTGIDTTLERGHKTAVIGPSGCGKSTMLRCINYMETPSSGHIYLDGELLPRPAATSTWTASCSARSRSTAAPSA